MSDKIECQYCGRIFGSNKAYGRHQQAKISCIQRIRIAESDKKYIEEHTQEVPERWYHANKERALQYAKDYYQRVGKQKYKDKYIKKEST
tara:strand:- start:28 stop:297 length:270 start_codon:yes stop_codon:yes gene_type:complete